MDNRRRSLLIIIFLLMVVTVPHVAIYAGSFEPSGSSWLGWPYSLAVEASVIICAYFTKWQTTRLWAWVGYFGFVVASGIMNVGYIQPDTFPAWTYALFPTAAISLLGFLYRQVDKLVQVAEAGKRPRAESAHPFGYWPLRATSSEASPAVYEQSDNGFAAKSAKSEHQADLEFICSLCDLSFPTRNSLNAHKRKHSQRPANISKEAWRRAVSAVRNANIRASKLGIEGELTPQEWLQVLDHYAPDGKCPSCGNITSLCLDHIKLLAHGGPNIIGNIQPLCGRCNSSKSGTSDYRFDGGEFAAGKVMVSANGSGEK